MDAFERFWEIDALRGIAIIAMVVSNFITDVGYFKIYPVDINSGFWWYFARIVAGTFIFLAGISLTLSYARAKEKMGERQIFLKYLKRGLGIFAWGLAITFATLVFIPKDFIIFGILHFIGLSIIIAYPFLNKRAPNFIYGIFFIIFGIFLSSFAFNFDFLLWLGFMPAGFHTVDYFPLFPWFGVFLLGIFAGNTLYANYKRKFSIPGISNLFFTKIFCLLGRNSLLIYLAHQPIILFFLYMLGPLPLSNFFI